MTNDENKNPASEDVKAPAVTEPKKDAPGDGGRETPRKPKPATTQKQERGAGRTLFRLFILLVVLAALAAGGWFGWQWLQQQKGAYDVTLREQAAEIERLQARLDRAIETRVPMEEFTTLEEDLARTQQQLRDRLDSLANDMESLREAAQGGRRDLVSGEVEYLLRIAADELYLTQDVDTALYALQSADDRLRELADPRFNPVRQLIADHVQALSAINLPDTSGMAMKLGSLMRQVSDLPLRQSLHARAVGELADAAPEDAGWWQRAKQGVARLFDKLVVVQRAEPPAPLLTPEEHFFLYRNVEMQLAGARAALLGGDIAAYRQSLEIAREWLNRYFDQNDVNVQNTIADISGLLGVSLQPELPDITGALERFRTISANAARNRGARTQ